MSWHSNQCLKDSKPKAKPDLFFDKYPRDLGLNLQRKYFRFYSRFFQLLE